MSLLKDLPGLDEIRRATELVRTVTPPTPTYTWPLLNERCGAEVWIKHENHSPVGAFKLRGAMVYMDWLAREQPHLTGVVAATRGNHGQGVALAAKRRGWTATIVVPHGNSRENGRNVAHHPITPGASTKKANAQKKCTADSVAHAATGRKLQSEMSSRRLIF